MHHKNILRIRDENGLGEIYHELELRFDKIEFMGAEHSTFLLNEMLMLYI